MVDYDNPPQSCPSCGCCDFTRCRKVRGSRLEISTSGTVRHEHAQLTLRCSGGWWTCLNCGHVHRMPADEFKSVLADAVGDPSDLVSGWVAAGLLPPAEVGE